jgi:glycosyltransferase involved in cell wall biosynthesis
LPTVCSDATGCRDSVVNGVTGFIFPKGDAVALAEHLSTLLDDQETARSMGRAARKRVEGDFSQVQVWRNFDEFATRVSAESERLAAGARSV